VLPKSTHRERLEQNAQVFDFTLSDEDMAALDASTPSTAPARRASPWWYAQRESRPPSTLRPRR
jgi:diketogulonate reductase-like aldo/keto reductase